MCAMNTIKQAKEKIIERLIELKGRHSAIAREIGVDPSTLSKIARAGFHANPTVDLLIALEEQLFIDESAQMDIPNQSSLGLPEHSECGGGVLLS